MIVILSLYILQHGLKHLLCDWHYAGVITIVSSLKTLAVPEEG